VSSPDAPQLAFEDWIAQQEHRRSDWLVVGRIRTWASPYGLFTVSTLVPNDSEQLGALFDEASWGITCTNLGRPGFNLEDDGPLYYPDSVGMGRLRHRSFTLYRSFPHTYPTYLDLLQEFVLYHNGHHDHEQDEWVGFMEDGGEYPLARRIASNEETRMEVSTDAVRDFLAATGCVLVRHHDHTRESPAAGVRIGAEDGIWRREVRDRDRLYDVSVAALWSDSGRLVGRLLGFDVVWPYEELPARRRWWDDSHRQYAEFVVGVDEQGRDVTHTCNNRNLDWRADSPQGPFPLTPVFFTVDVLDKYRRDPTKYSHDGRVVRQGAAWLLQYDTNSEGLIQVWLKDLGLIPFREQLHWRAHNVRPAGGISEARYRQDILAEFLEEPPDLADRMWLAYRDANAATKREWGFPIFVPLADADTHVAHAIAWPIADRAKDRDDQIGAAAKVLCDSIDVSALRRSTGLEIDSKDGPIRGSNDLLGAALSASGLSDEEVQEVIGPLRALQALRSSGVAHHRGAKWEKAGAAAGIGGLRPRAAWDKLLGDFVSSLKALARYARPLCGGGGDTESTDEAMGSSPLPQ